MKCISNSRLLLSLAVTFALVSAIGAQEASATLPRFSPGQLREDFQIARRSLEEGHSGIYRYTPKAELDRVFDAAWKSLNRPMDAVEFFRVLAPAVAAIKCGHTNVTLPEAFRKEINNTFPLLPFQVRVLKGRAYIFRDFADAGNPHSFVSLAFVLLSEDSRCSARKISPPMQQVESNQENIHRQDGVAKQLAEAWLLLDRPF